MARPWRTRRGQGGQPEPAGAPAAPNNRSFSSRPPPRAFGPSARALIPGQQAVAAAVNWLVAARLASSFRRASSQRFWAAVPCRSMWVAR